MEELIDQIVEFNDPKVELWDSIVAPALDAAAVDETRVDVQNLKYSCWDVSSTLGRIEMIETSGNFDEEEAELLQLEKDRYRLQDDLLKVLRSLEADQLDRFEGVIVQKLTKK